MKCECYWVTVGEQCPNDAVGTWTREDGTMVETLEMCQRCHDAEPLPKGTWTPYPMKEAS